MQLRIRKKNRFKCYVIYSPQLQPGEYKDIHIPIVFTRLGSITVEVTGSTQMQGDSDEVTIDVQPEVRKPLGKHYKTYGIMIFISVVFLYILYIIFARFSTEP